MRLPTFATQSIRVFGEFGRGCRRIVFWMLPWRKKVKLGSGALCGKRIVVPRARWRAEGLHTPTAQLWNRSVSDHMIAFRMK